MRTSSSASGATRSPAAAPTSTTSVRPPHPLSPRLALPVSDACGRSTPQDLTPAEWEACAFRVESQVRPAPRRPAQGLLPDIHLLPALLLRPRPSRTSFCSTSSLGRARSVGTSSRTTTAAAASGRTSGRRARRSRAQARRRGRPSGRASSPLRKGGGDGPAGGARGARREARRQTDRPTYQPCFTISHDRHD